MSGGRLPAFASAVRAVFFACSMSCVLACGASHKKVEAPLLAPANPQALAKLVQGVQSAKDPGGKDRAIGLLKDAVTADPRLWEAHYNLGVLLADKGDLKAAERELSEAANLAPNAEDVVVALSEVRRRADDASGAIDISTLGLEEGRERRHRRAANLREAKSRCENRTHRLDYRAA